jgi:hypothetical protein
MSLAVTPLPFVHLSITKPQYSSTVSFILLVLSFVHITIIGASVHPSTIMRTEKEEGDIYTPLHALVLLYTPFLSSLHEGRNYY